MVISRKLLPSSPCSTGVAKYRRHSVRRPPSASICVAFIGLTQRPPRLTRATEDSSQQRAQAYTITQFDLTVIGNAEPVIAQALALLRRNTGICVSDVETADIAEDLKATARAESLAALAFIPLVAYGELIGKFMTYCEELLLVAQSSLLRTNH
jgi:hypothetical protein